MCLKGVTLAVYAGFTFLIVFIGPENRYSDSIQYTKGQTEDQVFQDSSCQSTSLINNCIITLTNECKFKSIYSVLIAGTVSWG